MDAITRAAEMTEENKDEYIKKRLQIGDGAIMLLGYSLGVMTGMLDLIPSDVLTEKVRNQYQWYVKAMDNLVYTDDPIPTPP